MIVLRMLFCSTATRCLCDRPLSVDLRNSAMRNVQLTCRAWRSRWRVFAIYMCIHKVPFCSYPSRCAVAYVDAAPRLPTFRRATGPDDRPIFVRVYKNGRVLVIVKSPNAEKPGDGTEN